jgi:hypothetical protein
MTRYYPSGFATLLALSLAPAALAGPPDVYTPAPGSPERTAIVKTLHAGDDSAQSRFTFRAFRVLSTGRVRLPMFAPKGRSVPSRPS